MPISKRSSGGSRTARVAGAIAIFLLAATALNIALCYALCPYGGLSETIWSEWRSSASGTADTVFLGSSFGHRDIDPARVDAELGSVSFNLSTPGQTLASSHEALKRLSQEPQLKRVVLCAGFETFAEADNVSASIAFTQAMVQSDPLPEALATYLRCVVLNPNYLGGGSSVAALFPWTYSRVPLTPSAIAGNIKNRMTYATPLEAAPVLDPNITFVGQGFATYEGASDMTLSLGQTAAMRYASEKFTDEHLEEVRAMVRLCAEKGIDFVLLITPRPAQELICRGDAYPREMERLRALVLEEGGRFIDFAMARPSYYEPAPSELYDFEHLNLEGAERFSALLGRHLAQGDDAKGIFSYAEWSEYVAAERDINFCSLEAACTGSSIEASASAFPPAGREVEFRFTITDHASGEVLLDTGFGTQAQLSYPVSGHGAIMLRVEARLLGGTQNPWSYDQQLVSY